MGGDPSRQAKSPFDDYAAAKQPQQSHPRKLAGLRQIDRVRFFRVGLGGRKSDHLTSVSRGREGGSGLGTAPPA
jgi:hypothetical protein